MLEISFYKYNSKRYITHNIIITCYLGWDITQKRYEQHSNVLPRYRVIISVIPLQTVPLPSIKLSSNLCLKKVLSGGI